MKYSKGHIPLYFQVYLKLKQDIILGEYNPGSMFPSLITLHETLGISHGMIRKALDLLENEGIIIKKQRIGTFVNENIYQPMSTAPLPSLDEARIHLEKIKTYYLSDEWIDPPNRIKKIFQSENNIFNEDKIFKSHFVLVGKTDNDSKRRVLIDLYLPLWRYNQLAIKQFQKNPLKVAIDKIDVTSTKNIIRPWFCNAEASEYLKIPVGSPIFHFTFIIYHSHNKPFIYMEQLSCVNALERYVEIH